MTAIVGYPAAWDEVTPRRDRRAEWQRRKDRVRREYHRRRAALLRRLGGECAQCGEDDDELLQFDHPHGRTWEPREKNRMQRMRLYERDHVAGLIQLLCKSCNGYDGSNNRRRYAEIKRGGAS